VATQRIKAGDAPRRPSARLARASVVGYTASVGIIRAAVELLLQHKSEVIGAGLTAGVIAGLLTVAVGIGLIIALRRRGFGRAGTVGLALATALAAVGMGTTAAIPGCVERATEIVASHSTELRLDAPMGMLLLAPVVDAYTDEGRDGQAVDDMHGPHGVDLAVIARPMNRTQLIARITIEQLKRSAKTLRRELRVPQTRVPPRLIRRVLDSAQRAFIASPDIYDDLLGALTPSADGQLGVRVGAAQVGRRFFETHAPTVALRGLGYQHWWIALCCGLPMLLMAAVNGIRLRHR